MKLEPGRYKFARLPVRDLGEGSCGTWEVRPRFGLIGMLAGWWQVKLSSGCPLPWGLHARAAPSSPARCRSSDRQKRTVWLVDLLDSPDREHLLATRAREHRGQGVALAFGH